MRVRIYYQKNAVLRYTGNLDMQRSWERTLRRAHLPVAYSQGFHPQPRIHQAAALPLGFTSREEVVDVWFDQHLPLKEVEGALRAAAPPGVGVIRLEEVDPAESSLQSRVIAAEYSVSFIAPPDVEFLQPQIDSLLEAETCIRTRRDKTYDLRPLIEELRIVQSSTTDQAVVEMRLAARESATGRPDEVLDALGIEPASALIERLRLIFQTLE